jgi:DNA-binding GntR family transcriptional regulator
VIDTPFRLRHPDAALDATRLSKFVPIAQDPSSTAGLMERQERSRAAAVLQQLRSDILSGALPPGHKLGLAELCERYGAGMSPIREALNQLAADQLVRLLPQRGFWVAPVSRAELQDLTRTRVRLETMALADSLERGDAEWEASLLAAEHRLAALDPGRGQTPPSPPWESLHRAFHLTLVGACGSPVLLRLLGQLHDQFDRYRRVAGAVAGPRTGHRAIVQAALARDRDLACRRLTRHIEETAAQVAARLADLEGPT